MVSNHLYYLEIQTPKQYSTTAVLVLFPLQLYKYRAPFKTCNEQSVNQGFMGLP